MSDRILRAQPGWHKDDSCSPYFGMLFSKWSSVQSHRFQAALLHAEALPAPIQTCPGEGERARFLAGVEKGGSIQMKRS